MMNNTTSLYAFKTNPALHVGHKGFTLIELVITIAIVGILTAIAIPSYQSFVIKSNRKAAATCLMEQAQFAERYYTTNLTYVGIPTPTPAAGCVADLVNSGRYTFPAPTGVSARTYVYTATATGAQLQDTKCLNLTINQTGAKTISGSGSASECFSR
jgi:type IV pilus assembly protein PilE